jgi:segregation and condensation protein B
MPPSPDPPFDSQPPGISLDELAEAFAQVMGVEPRQAASNEKPRVADEGRGTGDEARGVADEGWALQCPSSEPASDSAAVTGDALAPPAAEDPCPISPRSILEAMLFVGNRENRPLSPGRAADLMRDVEPDEIPPLIDDLNKRYAAGGAPYRIVGDGDGYRLTLGSDFHSLRNRFYGRIREARLSQAAVDVLALVAYQQPITGETIGRVRGKPSNHVLAHLVRRGLLKIERPDPKRRTPHYLTTDRFLRLFNLQSLADLPRSEDSGAP